MDMKDKIEIEIDFESKKLYSVKGADKVHPLKVAKLFFQLGTSALNSVEVGEKSKIIKPELNIIKGA